MSDIITDNTKVNEQLLKENDELNKQLESYQETIRGINKDKLNVINANNELKASVERLRKALDAIADTSGEEDWNDLNRAGAYLGSVSIAKRALNEVPSQSLNHIKAQVEEEAIEQFNTLGIWKWLSAALDDENVCAEMKIDITETFTFLETRKYKEQSE